MSKRESKNRLKKRSKAYIRGLVIIDIICMIAIIFIIAVGSFFTFTKKDEYRDAGIEYYNQNNYIAAITNFDKSLSTKQLFSSKIDVDSLMYKADCYILMDKFAEARDTYQTILDDYDESHYVKDDIEFLVKLSNALISYSEGEYIGCNMTFEEAVSRGYNEISLYAGNCYEKAKDYENMFKYYSIYKDDFGMDSFLYYKFATYYIMTNDYQTAITYISDGLNCGDDLYHQKLLYTQIMCNIEIDQYNEAFEQANLYVEQYPDDEEGKSIYEFLDTRVNPNEIPINDFFKIETR